MRQTSAHIIPLNSSISLKVEAHTNALSTQLPLEQSISGTRHSGGRTQNGPGNVDWNPINMLCQRHTRAPGAEEARAKLCGPKITKRPETHAVSVASHVVVQFLLFRSTHHGPDLAVFFGKQK